MNIALVTTEYPPDYPFGGIATYMKNISKILSDRGHHVEIFTHSPSSDSSSNEGNVLIHRIFDDSGSLEKFKKKLCEKFEFRQNEIGFEVIESQEINAPCKFLKDCHPEIPLVIKLHTPSYLVNELNYIKPTLSMKARWYLGALKKFKIPKPLDNSSYNPEMDIERIHTCQAEEITTPSVDLGEILKNDWGLPGSKVVHLPNPYIPTEKLLNITPDTDTGVITFIGRLEIRKGILDLLEAIPAVIEKFPGVKFRFIGPAWPSPDRNKNMHEYIVSKLSRYSKSLEFTGVVKNELLHEYLAKTDICVFPSYWENFPNVCLEAMSAARGVVGSSAGGMTDMLDKGKAGLLVPPKNPEKLAEAITLLLNKPSYRKELGKKARKRVLDEYNENKIGAMLEKSYKRAITRAGN